MRDNRIKWNDIFTELNSRPFYYPSQQRFVFASGILSKDLINYELTLEDMNRPSSMISPQVETLETVIRNQLHDAPFPYYLEWVDNGWAAIVTDLTFDYILRNVSVIPAAHSGTVSYNGVLVIPMSLLDQKKATTGPTTRLKHPCPPSPEDSTYCIHCGEKL